MVRTLSFHCMHACACMCVYVCVCVCVCVCRGVGGGVHGSIPVWELRQCEAQPKKKKKKKRKLDFRLERSWKKVEKLLYCNTCFFCDSHFFVLYCVSLTTTTKSFQSCPTLCDPIDGSPPGSPVPGILQARRLEWVAISFSNA